MVLEPLLLPEGTRARHRKFGAPREPEHRGAATPADAGVLHHPCQDYSRGWTADAEPPADQAGAQSAHAAAHEVDGAAGDLDTPTDGDAMDAPATLPANPPAAAPVTPTQSEAPAKTDDDDDL